MSKLTLKDFTEPLSFLLKEPVSKTELIFFLVIETLLAGAFSLALLFLKNPSSFSFYATLLFFIAISILIALAIKIISVWIEAIEIFAEMY